MRIGRRLRPGPAMGVAFAALFVALGGTALSQSTPPPGTAPVTCNVVVHAEHGDGVDKKGIVATIVGTDGSDVLSGTPARDVIAGLGGDDTVSGLAGDDVICGGAGDDTLKGGKGEDKLYGGDGNDKLYGREGPDLLYGGAGNDLLNVGSVSGQCGVDPTGRPHPCGDFQAGGPGKDKAAHQTGNLKESIESI
jgi:Ca2+-binding RTX toxin-like protein